MITTANTIQGEYTKNYKLGLAINDTTNLAENIKEYLKTFDKEEYEENRKKLLETFLSDKSLRQFAATSFYSSNLLTLSVLLKDCK